MEGLFTMKTNRTEAWNLQATRPQGTRNNNTEPGVGLGPRPWVKAQKNCYHSLTGTHKITPEATQSGAKN